MQTVLMVVHLFVAIALVCVVLLQKSEGGALGMGGGSGGGIGGFFSPRGAANTLTRTTAILGLVFFLTSLSLTWLALKGLAGGSILDSGQPAPASTPGAPSVPAGRMPRPIAPAPGTTPAPAATVPAPAPAAPAAPAP